MIYISLILFAVIGQIFIENNKKNWQNGFLLLLFLLLFIFLGLRYNVGSDYQNYANRFINNYHRGNIEILFNKIVAFVNYFSLNYQMGFIISAAITMGFYFLGIRNLMYIKNKYIILLTFFAFEFYFFTFNAVRQGIALSIFLFSIKFIQEKKILPYIFFISLAVMFHFSSIILFPMYFLLNLRFNKKVYFIMLTSVLFSSVILLFLPYDIFFEYLPFNYSNYIETRFIEFGGYYILVTTIILTIVITTLINKIDLFLVKSNSNIIYINLAFFSMIFLILSNVIWLFSRIAIYFQIGWLVLLPELEVIFKRKDKNLVHFLLIIGLFVLTATSILTNRHGISNYKMFNLFLLFWNWGGIMLSDEFIICFSNNDRRNVPTNKDFIMDYLSKKNEVIYIESIGTRTPNLNVKDIKKIIKKINNLLYNFVFNQKNKKGNDNSNLKILSPLFIPIYENKIIDKINKFILKSQIYMMKKSKKRPILWSFIPTSDIFLGELNEKISIYHLVDKNYAFDNIQKNKIKKKEDYLILNSDIKLFSNYKYFKEFKDEKNSYHIPHGIKEEEKIELRNDNKYLKIKEIKKLKLVFAGKITDYINFDIVLKILKKNKDIQIIFIGPNVTENKNSIFQNIKKFNNFLHIRKITHKKLYEYIKICDIGFLPFENHEQIVYAEPNIMYEFMYLNKTIISIDIPATNKFRENMFLFTNEKECLEIVSYIKNNKKEISEKANNLKKISNQFLLPNTVEKISNIIKDMEG